MCERSAATREGWLHGNSDDSGSMLTEVVRQKPSSCALNDQIQASYDRRWPPRQSAQLVAEVNEIQGFHMICSSPGPEVDLQGLALSLSTSLEDSSRLESFNFVQGRQLPFHGQLGIGIDNSKNVLTQSCPFYYPRFVSDHEPQVGTMSVLRSTRYLKAAQELLEEFCSVWRGQMANQERNPNTPNSKGSGSGSGMSGSRDHHHHHPLTPSERAEYQRRKIRLLSMLDEVDSRYVKYCSHMEAMVKPFDSMVGHGAAVTYTRLAQKAMSRHFRVLKDAIKGELRACCEALGVQDGIGLSKGETPRLKALEQKYRVQNATAKHAPGMTEPELWRPQRGLPERAVNVLRSWLFEHFLNPYPNEADKQMLSRQTSLSRSQVSNWFINARVRLWKPMVEQMYNREFQDEEVQPGAASPTAGPELHDNNSSATSLPAERGPSPENASNCGRREPLAAAVAGDVSLSLGLTRVTTESVPTYDRTAGVWPL